MSTSNKTLLINGNVNFKCGNQFINTFYNNFYANIAKVYSNTSNGINDQIFQTVFGSSINSSDYQVLLASADSNVLYSQPKIAWELTNATDNALINILTIGVDSELPPTSDQQQNFSQSATAGNFSSSLKSVRDNQFSCQYSYTNYCGGKLFELNFLYAVTPNDVGGALGLIMRLDNNDISTIDAQILLNLINCYSNIAVALGPNTSPESSKGYTNSNTNFSLFTTQYNDSVNQYLLTVPTPSVRQGSDNTPASTIIRPSITDENNFYEINNNSVGSSSVINSSGVSGITLNQFDQPNFDSILSILDSLRSDTPNALIKSTDTSITIDGGEGDLQFVNGKAINPINNLVGNVGNNSNNPTQYTFAQLLKLKSKNGKTDLFTPDVKKACQDDLDIAIKKIDDSLAKLNNTQNSLTNSPEFIFTCIVAGIGTTSDVAKDKDGKYSISQDTRTDHFTRLLAGLQSEPTANGQTSTVNRLIHDVSYRDVLGKDKDFLSFLLFDLGIDINEIHPIDQSTITDIYSLTDNNPPPEVQTLVSVINKSNIPVINRKMRAMCQGVVNQVKRQGTENKKLNNQKKQYEDIKKELS